jgi:uncharacterized protein YceH (UPF0502 family)
LSAGNSSFVGQLALSESETRVLGCLLEKQRTTPDTYPLTLNGLRAACNQSTNRDPVLSYEDGTIRDAVHRLERRGLARLASGRGSRAPKYRHLLAEALPMSSAEQAVMCVLMLRGAQTPGELKQRAERMHRFEDLHAVETTLGTLAERGLVERRERRPGQKEERYAQLLEGAQDGARREATGAVAEQPDGSRFAASTAGESPQQHAGQHALAGVRETAGAGESTDAHDAQRLAARVESLERRVAELAGELAALRAGRSANGQAEAEV